MASVKPKVYLSCSVDSQDDHKVLLNKLFDIFNSAEIEGQHKLVALKLGVPKKKFFFSKTTVESHIVMGRLLSHGLEKEKLLDRPMGESDMALPGHSRRCWISMVLKNTFDENTCAALLREKPEVQVVFDAYNYAHLPFYKGHLVEYEADSESFIVCLAANFQEKRARSLGIVRLIDVIVVDA